MTKTATLRNLFQLIRRVPFTKQQNQNNIAMVGRWNLDYDVAIQNRKVYWANMDNCGCCHGDGGAVHAKIIKKKHETEDDEYILPYIM